MLAVELDHAERTRILHGVPEHRRAVFSLARAPHQAAHILSVEYVIAEDEANVVAAYKLLTEDERIGKSARRGLHLICNIHADPCAVAEQSLVIRGILRRRDNKDIDRG